MHEHTICNFVRGEKAHKPEHLDMEMTSTSLVTLRCARDFEAACLSPLVNREEGTNGGDGAGDFGTS